MAIDVRPVQRTQCGIRNARALRARQRQVADVGKHQVRVEFAQQTRLISDALVPIRMEGTIGRAAFPDTHIQRRRHHHADVAFAGQMGERRMDARTQMGKRHGRAYRDTQFGYAPMQDIQNRRGLCDMAETVAGDRYDEVRHLVEPVNCLKDTDPLTDCICRLA